MDKMKIYKLIFGWKLYTEHHNLVCAINNPPKTIGLPFDLVLVKWRELK